VGTHIESGFHRDQDGKTIDSSLSSAISFLRAQVIDARGSQTVTAAHFRFLEPETELAIFLTDNTTSKLLFSTFRKDYVGLDTSTVATLSGFPKLRVIGLDYISIESYSSDGTVHDSLFQNGILALESLNLAGAEPGHFTAVISVQILKGAEAGQCQVSLLNDLDIEALRLLEQPNKEG
jgi:kynurenine formamidase